MSSFGVCLVKDTEAGTSGVLHGVDDNIFSVSGVDSGEATFRAYVAGGEEQEHG